MKSILSILLRTDYPEEVKWLHSYLMEKYAGYGIFCCCPGHFYNISLKHRHDGFSDWILIAYYGPFEVGSFVHFYPDPEDTRTIERLEWHDPQMLEKITSHIDNCIEKYGIERHTATI